VKKARVNTKTPNQDKDRCHICNELGHWAKKCPQNPKNQGGQNTQGAGQPPPQKPFPGYNYMYQQSAFPQMPTGLPQQAQMQMPPDQTAMMGQMRDVMIHVQDFAAEDNPLFMHIGEVTAEESIPSSPLN